MSRHSFDPEVAAQVGLNAAVIYQNILWWAEKNAANGRHVINGHVWTYNSRRAFAELFSYLTEKQIRVALDRLVEAGLLIKGNFNDAGYDRTSWYAPTCSAEWVSAIGPVGPAHWPSGANPLGVEGQPIPDSKPDQKPDGKHLGAFQDFWDAFPHRKGKKDKRASCEARFAKAVKAGVDPQTIIAAARQYREDDDVMRGYGRAAETWLSQRGWEDEPAEVQPDFHAQIDAMLRGNDELRRTDEIDNRPRQPLLVGMEAPRASDKRDGDDAPAVHRGSYQQEVASLLKPRRIGGSVF